MDLKSVEDFKKVVGMMHDSEFTDKDLSYDAQKKKFSLKSRISDNSKEFLLDIYNVEEYTPVNLERINKGQATGGVFNDIRIKNHGLSLEIISQDLRILLRLSKLAGNFIQITR